MKGLWADDSGVHTWSDFGSAVDDIRRRCVDAGVAGGDVVVTPGAASLESLASLFGAAGAGATVAPLRPERAAEMDAWKEHFEVAWMIRQGRILEAGEGRDSVRAASLFAELRLRSHPGLILATGGTTGTPKLVLHDLEALLAAVPVTTGRAWRTMPLMRFDHIGGLDAAWRALAGGQVLVAPPDELSAETVADAIQRHGVEVLPATPSFLNLLILSGVLESHSLETLRVVPYGAEPMPGGLLDRLRGALPQVEFVQRFGTSETGALPVRGAGQGLSIGPNEAGYAWKVLDGELWVLSPGRALGYLVGDESAFGSDGWFRTGDLAERLPDGSIRVLGRREDVINVGGEKILPGGIEEVLRRHPLVGDCRVFPKANPILGQVVAAEVVWMGQNADPLLVKRQLREFAAASLPNCHLPTVVRLVAEIETTRNLKKSRQTSP